MSGHPKPQFHVEARLPFRNCEMVHCDQSCAASNRALKQRTGRNRIHPSFTFSLNFEEEKREISGLCREVGRKEKKRGVSRQNRESWQV